jgi:trimethylamine--corrinoid protein Co-methyltransferase
MFALSGTEIERIDRASLRILEEIGVRVDDADLRGRALKAGARPGRSADWILMPTALVRKLVALAPSTARYADCQGCVTEVGPGRESTFWTGAALNYIEGGQSRAITSADLAAFTRVADALDTVFATVGTSLADVPPQARDVVGLRVMAENTRKHLRPLLFSAANVPAMVEIAQIIAGGRDLKEGSPVSFGYSCLSPLHWSQITIDMWRNSAGHRIPVMLNGEPIAGATSPVTLAGSVALSNAEILSGAALCQLVEEGRPVIHNLGFAHALDMRSAACLSGSPECAMMAHAGARLAAYYNLPSASWMCTDSLLDDEQSTLEKMITGVAHVHGNVSVIWGMGQLETEKSLSAVQLVMDHEVALALRRLQAGFEVNDDTLAYDAIRDVVEGGQEFISHEHTLANFRRELSNSPLLNRVLRRDWENGGSTTFSARAKHKVEEILAAPAKSCLTDQQRKDIAKVEQQVLKTVS